MVWGYILAAVVIFLLLKELIRLPTVGKYGERYVFITGCDTGFGNLLAKRLDSLGFNVFAGCLTEKGEVELKKVSSDRLKTILLDVTKLENIMKAREFVEKALPVNKGLWAIVNNAGILGNISNTEMLTRADYEACLAVNLYGVIDVTRVFQPLVRKERGRIVNMSSMIAIIAGFFCPYAISKFGVEAFSDCLRREVLSQGITVHLLEPKLFKTDLADFDVPYRLMDKSYRAANQEVQVYYGKNFVDEVKTLIDNSVGRSVSTKTYLVVDAYVHAITAVFPRARYLIGWDKYFLFVLWNLPECISDRIINRDMAKPEGAR